MPRAAGCELSGRELLGKSPEGERKPGRGSLSIDHRKRTESLRKTGKSGKRHTGSTKANTVLLTLQYSERHGNSKRVTANSRPPRERARKGTRPAQKLAHALEGNSR